MTTTFICAEGLTEPLKQEHLANNIAADILELKTKRPMLPQLLRIEDFEDVVITPDPRWTKLDKEHFVRSVMAKLNSLVISQNTVTDLNDQWHENAFWNHEAAMTAKPITELELLNLKADAIVVGAGPSAKGLERQNAVTYAAWSTSKNINFPPTFLAHCDSAPVAELPAVTGSSHLLFTPYCTPSFVGLCLGGDKYVYLDDGNLISCRFAQKRNLEEHRGLGGCVLDMMLQCAIYAGHSKIGLIGADLSFQTLEGLLAYRPDTEVIEALNYRGEVVYTDPVFMLYKECMEASVPLYPDIEFVNHADTGMILEGFPYQPLD